VDDWREERIAKNESRFREINERLTAGLRQIPHNPELLEFICECGNPACQQHVQLSLDEYERVRSDSRRFAVVPGHVIPEAERVIWSHDRFEVVEKHGPAVDLVDEADQRASGPTGLRDTRP
jgi:hypothetical protein